MSPGNICDVGQDLSGPCRNKEICWMIRKAEEFMKSLHGTGPKLAVVSCKFYQEKPQE